MNILRYDSLNEKLRLCYNCLNDNLTQEERTEIEQEIREYRTKMDKMLLGEVEE